MNDGLVMRNVADTAKPPRASSAKPPKFPTWTKDELKRFLASVESDDDYALYRLAAMTGMRRGELLGLRWSDIDFDKSMVIVRNNAVKVGKVVEMGKPKTATSRREVSLDKSTLVALKAHRANQAELRLLMGHSYDDQDLVFCQPDGAPVNPEAISNRFLRRAKAAKVTRIRFHDLRHTHATHLAEANVNAKVICERLGHSSVAFTLQRYVHPSQSAHAAAATAFADSGRFADLRG